MSGYDPGYGGYDPFAEEERRRREEEARAAAEAMPAYEAPALPAADTGVYETVRAQAGYAAPEEGFDPGQYDAPPPGYADEWGGNDPGQARDPFAGYGDEWGGHDPGQARDPFAGFVDEWGGNDPGAAWSEYYNPSEFDTGWRSGIAQEVYDRQHPEPTFNAPDGSAYWDPTARSPNFGWDPVNRQFTGVLAGIDGFYADGNAHYNDQRPLGGIAEQVRDSYFNYYDRDGRYVNSPTSSYDEDGNFVFRPSVLEDALQETRNHDWTQAVDPLVQAYYADQRAQQQANDRGYQAFQVGQYAQEKRRQAEQRWNQWGTYAPDDEAFVGGDWRTEYGIQSQEARDRDDPFSQYQLGVIQGQRNFDDLVNAYRVAVRNRGGKDRTFAVDNVLSGQEMALVVAAAASRGTEDELGAYRERWNLVHGIGTPGPARSGYLGRMVEGGSAEPDLLGFMLATLSLPMVAAEGVDSAVNRAIGRPAESKGALVAAMDVIGAPAAAIKYAIVSDALQGAGASRAAWELLPGEVPPIGVDPAYQALSGDPVAQFRFIKRYLEEHPEQELQLDLLTAPVDFGGWLEVAARGVRATRGVRGFGAIDTRGIGATRDILAAPGNSRVQSSPRSGVAPGVPNASRPATPRGGLSGVAPGVPDPVPGVVGAGARPGVAPGGPVDLPRPAPGRVDRPAGPASGWIDPYAAETQFYGSAEFPPASRAPAPAGAPPPRGRGIDPELALPEPVRPRGVEPARVESVRSEPPRRPAPREDVLPGDYDWQPGVAGAADDPYAGYQPPRRQPASRPEPAIARDTPPVPGEIDVPAIRERVLTAFAELGVDAPTRRIAGDFVDAIVQGRRSQIGRLAALLPDELRDALVDIAGAHGAAIPKGLLGDGRAAMREAADDLRYLLEDVDRRYPRAASDARDYVEAAVKGRGRTANALARSLPEELLGEINDLLEHHGLLPRGQAIRPAGRLDDARQLDASIADVFAGQVDDLDETAREFARRRDPLGYDDPTGTQVYGAYDYPTGDRSAADYASQERAADDFRAIEESGVDPLYGEPVRRTGARQDPRLGTSMAIALRRTAERKGWTAAERNAAAKRYGFRNWVEVERGLTDVDYTRAAPLDNGADYSPRIDVTPSNVASRPTWRDPAVPRPFDRAAATARSVADQERGWSPRRLDDILEGEGFVDTEHVSHESLLDVYERLTTRLVDAREATLTPELQTKIRTAQALGIWEGGSFREGGRYASGRIRDLIGKVAEAKQAWLAARRRRDRFGSGAWFDADGRNLGAKLPAGETPDTTALKWRWTSGPLRILEDQFGSLQSLADDLSAQIADIDELLKLHADKGLRASGLDRGAVIAKRGERRETVAALRAAKGDLFDVLFGTSRGGTKADPAAGSILDLARRRKGETAAANLDELFAAFDRLSAERKSLSATRSALLAEIRDGLRPLQQAERDLNVVAQALLAQDRPTRGAFAGEIDNHGLRDRNKELDLDSEGAQIDMAAGWAPGDEQPNAFPMLSTEGVLRSIDNTPRGMPPASQPAVGSKIPRPRDKELSIPSRRYEQLPYDAPTFGRVVDSGRDYLEPPVGPRGAARQLPLGERRTVASEGRALSYIEPAEGRPKAAPTGERRAKIERRTVGKRGMAAERARQNAAGLEAREVVAQRRGTIGATWARKPEPAELEALSRKAKAWARANGGNFAVAAPGVAASREEDPDTRALWLLAAGVGVGGVGVVWSRRAYAKRVQAGLKSQLHPDLTPIGKRFWRLDTQRDEIAAVVAADFRDRLAQGEFKVGPTAKAAERGATIAALRSYTTGGHFREMLAPMTEASVIRNAQVRNVLDLVGKKLHAELPRLVNVAPDAATFQRMLGAQIDNLLVEHVGKSVRGPLVAIPEKIHQWSSAVLLKPNPGWAAKNIVEGAAQEVWAKQGTLGMQRRGRDKKLFEAAEALDNSGAAGPLWHEQTLIQGAEYASTWDRYNPIVQAATKTEVRYKKSIYATHADSYLTTALARELSLEDRYSELTRFLIGQDPKKGLPQGRLAALPDEAREALLHAKDLPAARAALAKPGVTSAQRKLGIDIFGSHLADARDFADREVQVAMRKYTRRSNLDVALSVVYPFHYWQTRGTVWNVHMAKRYPLASAAVAVAALYYVNEGKDLPLSDKVNLRLDVRKAVAALPMQASVKAKVLEGLDWYRDNHNAGEPLEFGLLDWVAPATLRAVQGADPENLKNLLDITDPVNMALAAERLFGWKGRSAVWGVTEAMLRQRADRLPDWLDEALRAGDPMYSPVEKDRYFPSVAGGAGRIGRAAGELAGMGPFFDGVNETLYGQPQSKGERAAIYAIGKQRGLTPEEARRAYYLQGAAQGAVGLAGLASRGGGGGSSDREADNGYARDPRKTAGDVDVPAGEDAPGEYVAKTDDPYYGVRSKAFFDRYGDPPKGDPAAIEEYWRRNGDRWREEVLFEDVAGERREAARRGEIKAHRDRILNGEGTKDEKWDRIKREQYALGYPVDGNPDLPATAKAERTSEEAREAYRTIAGEPRPTTGVDPWTRGVLDRIRGLANDPAVVGDGRRFASKEDFYAAPQEFLNGMTPYEFWRRYNPNYDPHEFDKAGAAYLPPSKPPVQGGLGGGMYGGIATAAGLARDSLADQARAIWAEYFLRQGDDPTGASAWLNQPYGNSGKTRAEFANTYKKGQGLANLRNVPAGPSTPAASPATPTSSGGSGSGSRPSSTTSTGSPPASRGSASTASGSRGATAAPPTRSGSPAIDPFARWLAAERPDLAAKVGRSVAPPNGATDRPLEPGPSAKETAQAWAKWEELHRAGDANVADALPLLTAHARAGGNPAPYVRRAKNEVYRLIRDYRGATRQAGDRQRGEWFAAVKALPEDLAGLRKLAAIEAAVRRPVGRAA